MAANLPHAMDRLITTSGQGGKMTPPKLSILIAALPDRLPCKVWEKVSQQAAGKPVEILYFADNKGMSVGRKRNILLSCARGDYFAFIDDDDDVADDYVEMLLAAIEQHPGVDVVCFRQKCTYVNGWNGEPRVEWCRYSLQQKDYSLEKGALPGEWEWRGKPAHTMCWRTDAVQDVEFPEGNFGEDVGWVAKACERAQTEAQLDWIGYFYNFDEGKSGTRG